MNWKRKMIGLSVLLMVGLVLLSGLSGNVHAERISGHYGTPPSNYMSIMSQYGFLYDSELVSNITFTDFTGLQMLGFRISTPMYDVYIGGANGKNNGSVVNEVIFEKSGKLLFGFGIEFPSENMTPNVDLNKGVLTVSNQHIVISGENEIPENLGSYQMIVYLSDMPRIDFKIWWKDINNVATVVVFGLEGKIYNTYVQSPLNRWDIFGRNDSAYNIPLYKSLLSSSAFGTNGLLENLNQIMGISNITSGSNTYLVYSFDVTMNEELQVARETPTPAYPVDRVLYLNQTFVATFNNVLSQLINTNVVQHYKGQFDTCLGGNNGWVYYIGDSNKSSMTIEDYHKGFLKLGVSSTTSTGGYFIFRINRDVWDSEFGNNTKVIVDGNNITKIPLSALITNQPSSLGYSIMSYSNKGVLVVIYFSHFSNHQITFKKIGNNSNNTGQTVSNNNVKKSSSSNINNWIIPLLVLLAIIGLLLWLIRHRGKSNGYYKEVEIEEITDSLK